MRILELHCQPVGPLLKPVYFRYKKNCTVVFDGNEAGKTSLVDIIVNLLFRKNTAQSRFQSRRFEGYDGYVKIEHHGEEVTCTGTADLDKKLGLPPEFSRLPIVRGGDLNFLWSSNKERKGPLIDACIQHFAADLEENLDAVIEAIRDRAGLPPKRNHWTKGKTEELQQQLDLYRKRETLLAALADQEQAGREQQAAAGRLQAVQEELATNRREMELLEDERQAALCASAMVWESKLLALKQQYREGGYERCSSDDLNVWAETAAREAVLLEQERSLREEVRGLEVRLSDLKQRQEDLVRHLREAEAVSCSARDRLAELHQREEQRKLEGADALAEARLHLKSTLRSGEQKNRTKWALAAVPLLVVAVAAFFAVGLIFPGGIALIVALGITAWGLAVSRVCRRTEGEAEERIWQLLCRYGVQSAGSLESAVAALERHFQEAEARGAEELRSAGEECRELESVLQQLAQECALAEQGVENITASLRQSQSLLADCTGELELAQGVLQELRQCTGKPDRASLEDALQEKERLERECAGVESRLRVLLGGEDDWRERLLALKLSLEGCPDPCSLEELDARMALLGNREQELTAQEQTLQQEHNRLLQRKVEAARSLYAAGCEDLAGLALRLERAEEVLREAIRNSLAALWAQQAIERAEEEFEDLLLEPLARAGELFYQITGRYDTLTCTRENGDAVFSAAGEGVEYGEDALSDGTRAQLLLALRLALLERILGNEQGFLVLDDPLLNSSETRKRNTIGVLLDYARQGWQIFYLTVDPLAVEAFKELGGELVEVKAVGDFWIEEPGCGNK